MHMSKATLKVFSKNIYVFYVINYESVAGNNND